MEESNMTESLPKVRCTPEMRESLVALAQASVTTDLADHIRAAVQAYVDGGIDLTDEEFGRRRFARTWRKSRRGRFTSRLRVG